MGDKDTRFPRYRVFVKWEQDGGDEPWNKVDEDLPEGRMHNSTGWTEMHREEQDVAEIERETLEEWWPGYVEKKLAGKNPGPPTIEVRDIGPESWSITWFEHFTFDDGQTDAEFEASFERFVSRHEFYQDWPFDERSDADVKARGIEHRICLMGAEQRWRWGKVCRCEHCVEQGKVRIAH